MALRKVSEVLEIAFPSKPDAWISLASRDEDTLDLAALGLNVERRQERAGLAPRR